MSWLSQLLDKNAKQIAQAADALRRKDYHAFWEALPSEIRVGLLNFVMSKLPKGK